jgi:hypothetical protein
MIVWGVRIRQHRESEIESFIRDCGCAEPHEGGPKGHTRELETHTWVADVWSGAWSAAWV